MEIPIQQIWRCPAQFFLVGTIFLHSHTADQIKLLHKPLDGLVVQGQLTVMQICCDPAIAASNKGKPQIE